MTKKEILRKYWSFVQKLAERLVAKETLLFEDIAELREALAA